MAEIKKHVYDESKIKTLSSLEHIRLRTGMYIGRIGDGSHYDDGCYILLKEIIDNAIDEFIMGAGREVQIKIEDKSVTVRDFGRGIPLGRWSTAFLRSIPAPSITTMSFSSALVSTASAPKPSTLSPGIRGAKPPQRRVCRGLLQAGSAEEREKGQNQRAGRHLYSFRA